MRYPLATSRHRIADTMEFEIDLAGTLFRRIEWSLGGATVEVGRSSDAVFLSR